MRVEIICPENVKASDACHIRAILFNDSYEPVQVSRNAFVGPNLRSSAPGGFPMPESVEPSYGGADEPLTLQPFTFYGRERSFDNLQPGEIEVSVYYRDPDGQQKTANQTLRVS